MINIIDLVLSAPEPTNTARMVLLVLAYASDEEGKSWPSISYIARRCACSERTVRYALRELEEQEFITIEDRRPRSNLYHINLDRLKMLAMPLDEQAKSAGCNRQNLQVNLQNIQEEKSASCKILQVNLQNSTGSKKGQVKVNNTSTIVEVASTCDNQDFADNVDDEVYPGIPDAVPDSSSPLTSSPEESDLPEPSTSSARPQRSSPSKARKKKKEKQGAGRPLQLRIYQSICRLNPNHVQARAILEEVGTSPEEIRAWKEALNYALLQGIDRAAVGRILKIYRRQLLAQRTGRQPWELDEKALDRPAQEVEQALEIDRSKLKISDPEKEKAIIDKIWEDVYRELNQNGVSHDKP